MPENRESRSILALCITLATVALLAGFISTILIKNTVRDLEIRQDITNQKRRDLHRISMNIEHHLAQARSAIMNTLYKTGQLTTDEASTLSLGEVNKSIRELGNVFNAETIGDDKKVLDEIATDFVKLHYQALNWRTEYENSGTLPDINQTLTSIREYLDALPATREKTTTQTRKRRNHPNRTSKDPIDDSDDIKTLNKAIHRAAMQISKTLGAMASTSDETALKGITDTALKPELEQLHKLADAAAKSGNHTELPADAAQLDLFIFGTPPESDRHARNFNAMPGFYPLLVNRIAIEEERERLNNKLFRETARIKNSLDKVNSLIKAEELRLDLHSRELSTFLLDRLFIIQIVSAGIFLVIVFFVVNSVRKQVSLLTRLKTEAQRASIAKNHLLRSLKDNETRYRTLFKTLPGALVTTDNEGFIESFNPAAEHMFGYTGKDIIGKNIICLVSQDNRRALTAHLVRIHRFGSNTVADNIEMIALHRDGHTIPVTIALNEMVIDEKHIISGIILDITDKIESSNMLIQARDKAEASDRAKSEFLATMSHEIRTPLNGIMGMAQLLLTSDLPAKQRQFANSIQSAGTSLLSIINDVLDVSRAEAKRLELNIAPFDICALMHELSRMYYETATQKSIRFSCEYPPEIFGDYWLGDETRLRQVLGNLISNAIKFTIQGTVQLQLTIEKNDRTGASLRFAVRDSGIGISSEMKERIFDSFVQVDGSTTRQFGGSGLGLTICKRLVELMDGKIGVNSDPGQGSEFWFSIYLEKNTRSTYSPYTPPDNRIFPALHASILLVEDNEVNQLVTQHMLEKLHCKVSTAKNGLDAISAFEAEDFDLILMDCQMPVMDGYQASRVIREREQSSHAGSTPIIALTAVVTSEGRGKCLASGMNDYLSKPLTLEALSEALQRNLAGKESGIMAVPVQSGHLQRMTLNTSLLDELTSYSANIHLQKAVMDTYLAEVPTLISCMHESPPDDSSKQLASLAHRLKSASAQIGAEKLADLCQLLYASATREEAITSRQLIEQIDTEFEAVAAELRAMNPAQKSINAATTATGPASPATNDTESV